MVRTADAGTRAPATLAFDSACTLGESIVWCEREDALWWTDIKGKRIWQGNVATGAMRWWSTPGRVGSLALCDSGRVLLGMDDALYLAEPTRQQAGEEVHTVHLCDVPLDRPDQRINDGRLDRRGNFVFGCINEDPAHARTARFFQYSIARGLRSLALEPVAIANGICFDPDGDGMYYCDSLQGTIMHARYDAETAAVDGPRVFAVVEDGREPDGAVVDAEGRVWGAQWGAGQVVRYTPDGHVDVIVPVPAMKPTCVAFASDALDTLFITSARDGLDTAALRAGPGSGGVFRVVLEGVRGLPDRRFADA